MIDKVDALGVLRDNQAFISKNFKYRVGKNQKLNDDTDEESSTTPSIQDDEGDNETIQPLVEYHSIADEINEIINKEEPRNVGDEYNIDESEQSDDQMPDGADEESV